MASPKTETLSDRLRGSGFAFAAEAAAEIDWLMAERRGRIEDRRFIVRALAMHAVLTQSVLGSGISIDDAIRLIGDCANGDDLRPSGESPAPNGSPAAAPLQTT